MRKFFTKGLSLRNFAFFQKKRPEVKEIIMSNRVSKFVIIYTYAIIV